MFISPKKVNRSEKNSITTKTNKEKITKISFHTRNFLYNIVLNINNIIISPKEP